MNYLYNISPAIHIMSKLYQIGNFDPDLRTKHDKGPKSQQWLFYSFCHSVVEERMFQMRNAEVLLYEFVK